MTCYNQSIVDDTLHVGTDVSVGGEVARFPHMAFVEAGLARTFADLVKLRFRVKT